MGLLTSRWSLPMKHLLPYLQDDQKAAEYLPTRALARWWHVSTLWQRCGRVARTVRQRPAALQLCALCRALGPAVGHGHGLDECALRGEEVAVLRMVARARLIAMEAAR